MVASTGLEPILPGSKPRLLTNYNNEALFISYAAITSPARLKTSADQAGLEPAWLIPTRHFASRAMGIRQRLLRRVCHFRHRSQMFQNNAHTSGPAVVFPSDGWTTDTSGRNSFAYKRPDLCAVSFLKGGGVLRKRMQRGKAHPFEPNLTTVSEL